MTVIRLGSSEDEKEGVVLEVYGSGRKGAIRAWYTQHGTTMLIRARHLSREEIAAAFGLIVPERLRKRKRERHTGEELPA